MRRDWTNLLQPGVLVLLFSLFLSCSLIASFEREDQRPADTGPDGDGDSDSDSDTDSDGDQGRIVSISATPQCEGECSHPAGTSVLIDLVPNWVEEATPGVRVSILADNGGLVSRLVPNEFATASSLELETEEGGNLPTIRLTFPLEPWPYTTTLRWALVGQGGETAVTGTASYLVGEPEPQQAWIEGEVGEESIVLPRGLVVERYMGVDQMFDGMLDVSNGTEIVKVTNRIFSLTFTWDDSSSEMVVASEGELCFITATSSNECFRTLPEELNTEGPDAIHDLAFFESDGLSRGLYGAAYRHEGEDASSGLYSLERGGTAKQLHAVRHSRMLQAVPVNNHFAPSIGPAIYFFGEGELLAWTSEEEPVEVTCRSGGIYPESFALGDQDIYGNRAMFVVTKIEPESGDETLVEVLENSCSSLPVAQLRYVGNHPSNATASPGMVFGRMVYVAAGNEIVILLPPNGDDDQYFEFVPVGPALLQPRDMAFMPVFNGVEGQFHPPGLYLLDFETDAERILRIYQDLSEGGDG